jgi:AcrR family transcriptional regulator
MARPKVHDEDTRRDLLRAAGERLARLGIDAVTVRGVAADAHVTTRAVYALFGSRSELLRAMFADGFTAFDAALGAVPDSDDPAADLFRLGIAYRQSALDRPYLYDVMFVVDSAEFSPTAEDMDVCLSTIGRLRHCVERCVEAGVLAGDVDAITANAWALTHGLVLIERREMLGPDPTSVWRHSLAAFARGWQPAASHRARAERSPRSCGTITFGC